ncbi:MAG: thiamine-phosphate kinase [Methylophilaceae bacterium]
MPSEFNLIEKYFTHPAPKTDLGVGDDAALIQVKEGYQLAISTDTLVAGTHFFHAADAADIGWKSLAVNLSDMAAMGAHPKWATLAIALPEVNEAWLGKFSHGFFNCADAFNIDLIGGDTTRGPLNISITIMGEVPIGKALRRDSAQCGDEIWVSGELGNAALGLAHIEGEVQLPSNVLQTSLQALHRPQPRVNLGLALSCFAHSAIDISDGLLSDLGHILTASKLGAEIQLSTIPCSEFTQTHLTTLPLKCMLAGGDDYELCFTAPVNARDAILAISKKIGLNLSRIGCITAMQGLCLLDDNKMKIDLELTGYDHFA